MDSGLNMVWSRVCISFLNLSILFSTLGTFAGFGQSAFAAAPDVNRGGSF